MASLTVDLALAPAAADAFVDIASLAPLCRLTGGDLEHVPGFGASGGSAVDTGAARVGAFVRRAVCDAAVGSEGVLRVRTSPGLQVSRLVTGAGDPEVNVVNAPSIHADTTVAVELTHAAESKDGKDNGRAAGVPGERAFVQSALLYTHGDGSRRIRVSTRPLRVVREAAVLVRAVHPPTLAALQAKLACDDLARVAAKQVADTVEGACALTILAMRELCPTPLRRTADEMILTRPLELLPLLTLATLRLPPLAAPSPNGLGGPTPDAAAIAALRVLAMPAHLLCRMLVPRVSAIHLRDAGDGWVPTDAPKPPTPPESAAGSAEGDGANATAADDTAAAAAAATAPPACRELPMARGVEISPAGVYLLDSATELLLWVGQQAAPSFLNAVFGTATPRDGAPPLASGTSDEATKLHALIDAARDERPGLHPPLRVVIQGSPEQGAFFSRLVADGYEPFVMNLHGTRVQPKL